MLTKFYLATACLVTLLSATTRAQVRVVTTTADLAAIAAEIGGEHISVRTIAKSHQDAHTIQAKPSFMRHLNRADLLIYTGLELEVGWLPVLIRGARNPDVQLGADGHLNASAGIRVLDIPQGEIDRSMGDVHPEGNPHYLLNPTNGLTVGEAIRDRLIRIDPDRAGAYTAGFRSFHDQLSANIARWTETAAYLRGQPIATYHQQWEYLAEWLGLDIIGRVETRPGIPPSPRHVLSLVGDMRSKGVLVLLCTNHADPKAAERVCREAGALRLTFPIAPGGDPRVVRYGDLFDLIVNGLIESHPRATDG